MDKGLACVSKCGILPTEIKSGGESSGSIIHPATDETLILSFRTVLHPDPEDESFRGDLGSFDRWKA
jgi:hypothetical protein